MKRERALVLVLALLAVLLLSALLVPAEAPRQEVHAAASEEGEQPGDLPVGDVGLQRLELAVPPREGGYELVVDAGLCAEGAGRYWSIGDRGQGSVKAEFSAALGLRIALVDGQIRVEAETADVGSLYLVIDAPIHTVTELER